MTAILACLLVLAPHGTISFDDGSKSAVSDKEILALIQQLKSEDAKISGKASEALRDVGAAVLVPLNRASVHQEGMFLIRVMEIIESIVKRFPNEAKQQIPAVQALLEDKHPAIRGNAAATMAMIGAVDGVSEALQKLLNDPVISVQIQAAWSLILLDRELKQATKLIASHLKHENPAIRRQAAYALAGITAKFKRSLPPVELLELLLEPSLEDSDTTTRIFAGFTLALLDPHRPRAVSVIIDVIQSSTGDEPYATPAVQLIMELCNQGFGHRVLPPLIELIAKSDKEEEVLRFALEMCGSRMILCGDRMRTADIEAVTLILEKLARDENPRVQELARKWIEEFVALKEQMESMPDQ
jgi:HEAT repeats